MIISIAQYSYVSYMQHTIIPSTIYDRGRAAHQHKSSKLLFLYLYKHHRQIIATISSRQILARYQAVVVWCWWYQCVVAMQLLVAATAIIAGASHHYQLCMYQLCTRVIQTMSDNKQPWLQLLAYTANNNIYIYSQQAAQQLTTIKSKQLMLIALSLNSYFSYSQLLLYYYLLCTSCTTSYYQYQYYSTSQQYQLAIGVLHSRLLTFYIAVYLGKSKACLVLLMIQQQRHSHHPSSTNMQIEVTNFLIKYNAKN